MFQNHCPHCPVDIPTTTPQIHHSPQQDHAAAICHQHRSNHGPRDGFCILQEPHMLSHHTVHGGHDPHCHTHGAHCMCSSTSANVGRTSYYQQNHQHVFPLAASSGGFIQHLGQRLSQQNHNSAALHHLHTGTGTGITHVDAYQTGISMSNAGDDGSSIASCNSSATASVHGGSPNFPNASSTLTPRSASSDPKSSMASFTPTRADGQVFDSKKVPYTYGIIH